MAKENKQIIVGKINEDEVSERIETDTNVKKTQHSLPTKQEVLF